VSALAMAQIEATVFAFAGISGLEFDVGGTRWCGWENTCGDLPVGFRQRPSQ
jgi:hypothetical protein